MLLGALWPWSAVPAKVTADDAVVWIPAGWFTMGSDWSDVDYARRLCVNERLPGALHVRGCANEELFVDEVPARRVFVSAYGIDRREVSRARYLQCVLAGACTPSHLSSRHAGVGGPNHPVAGISWAQARDACRFFGGDLPTEAQWERAARGSSRRRFPWGQFYNERLANHGRPDMEMDPRRGRPGPQDGYLYASPVDAFESGASPYGLLNMAGNVWEWTADGYAPSAEQTTLVDPTGPAPTGLRVVRGGSWRSPSFTTRVTHRSARPEGGHGVDVGVRCAYRR